MAGCYAPSILKYFNGGKGYLTVLRASDRGRRGSGGDGNPRNTKPHAVNTRDLPDTSLPLDYSRVWDAVNKRMG
jgi:hypothetical protein